jgi:MHS family proline/betaine transporter-like MFS transporter
MNKNFWAGIIGNVCHYYNEALFGLLAPFISSIFFPHVNKTCALILTYAILPLGLLSRPLGAIVFGFIGDKLGRKKSIFLSLIGMSFATATMSCIPSFARVGVIASILLSISKTLQSFFAAGEITGGAIFVLEHFPEKRRSLLSSIYDASSIFGILFASLAVTLLGYFGNVAINWRYLPLFGVMTTIIGLFIRSTAQEPDTPRWNNEKIMSIIKKHSKQLGAIILVSGFSYINYFLALTLMNGYLPLISSITKTEATSINTVLLVLDLFMLPIFGFLAQKYSKEKIMLLGIITGMLTYIPLFSILAGATLYTSIIIRIMFVMIGVCFAAPLHHWTQSLVPPNYRFTIVALGYTIGAELLGTPTLAISVWLFKKTNLVMAPAFYAVIIAIPTAFMVYKLSKEKLS